MAITMTRLAIAASALALLAAAPMVPADRDYVRVANERAVVAAPAERFEACRPLLVIGEASSQRARFALDWKLNCELRARLYHRIITDSVTCSNRQSDLRRSS